MQRKNVTLVERKSIKREMGIMTFGERLALARRNKNLTQSELAELIGVKKSTITGYEKNNREPDLFKIKKIMSVLDITFDYLADIDTSKYRNNYNDDDEGIILYNSLDDIDKAEIRGEMRQMLKSDKYKTKDALA